MDFFDNVADFFTSLTSMLEPMIRGIFGSSNERAIRNIGYVRERDGNSHTVPGSVLDRINQLEPDMQKLSEGELRATTETLKQKLADGKTLEQILPEAFAAVRESGVR